MAIQSGRLDRARVSIRENPALLHARSSGNLTLLQVAANFQRQAFADELVAMGAKLDFISAVALGRVEEVRAMLAATPGLVRRQSPDRWGALHVAARTSSRAMLELLLSAGAEVNDCRNMDRFTPLVFAFVVRSLANAELLLEHGADANARNKHGFTVLHYAAREGDASFVELLLAHGACRDPQTDGRHSAWALAVRHGHRDVAALL